MAEQNNNLVPIGKYKGQPIEVLAEDKQYTDWLVAQPWFRDRYSNLYAVIINNFCEPSDTPEHNALQARFLDDRFRLKFASIASPRLWWFAQSKGEMRDKAAEWAASKIVTAGRCIEGLDCGPFFEGRAAGDSPYCDLIRQSGVTFEQNSVDAQWIVFGGIDVQFRNVDYRDFPPIFRQEFRVEIKPEIGDDYPSILRQMRRNGSRFLFTRAYTGTGVNQPTFIQYMDSQGIRVIFEHEVDAADDLRVDEFDIDEFFEAVKLKIQETKNCP